MGGAAGNETTGTCTYVRKCHCVHVFQMASMSAPELHEETILNLISHRLSYEEISRYLIQLTGQSHGFSSRNIRRFCSSRGVRYRGDVDDAGLDAIVRNLVGRVGHSYGRRTMHGLLQSLGFRVSQSRLASSMQRVAPIQYSARQHDMNRLINPFPYQATYFGEKIHLDQNEKCVMFGVTHVVAIDGYS